MAGMCAKYLPTPKPTTTRPASMAAKAPPVPLKPARNAMMDPRLAVARQKNIAFFLPSQSAKRVKRIAPMPHPM
jgi:hypothetical protein